MYSYIWIIILLHVWGSLGSITLARLQQCCTTLLRFLRYAAILGGLASLPDNNVNKQHFCARKNGRAFLWIRDWQSSNFEWYRLSLCWNLLEWRRVLKSRESSVVWRSFRVQTCLCVGLWTPIGWKTEFVSGNCKRSTWVYTVDDEDIRL
jgi:hypothetical protein